MTKKKINLSDIQDFNKTEVTITREVAEKYFGWDFVAKLFQYVHHQEIKETPLMKASRSELYGTCNRCDNCCGVECGIIHIPRNLIRICKNS